MPVLYVLTREWSLGHMVELGVGNGWSTLALLAGVAMAGRRLVSYDIEPSTRARALEAMGIPRDGPGPPEWEFRLKDSVEAAKDFADGSVGLWFLDTVHTYEATKAELSAWFPRICRYGVMCGHDYLLHLDPVWERTAGVKRAVDEFVAEHPERFSLQVLPNDMGLFILWPR